MSNNFFLPENHTVYEIMWKNMVEPERPQVTIRSMRFACWITKATDIHSEYVILTAFPLQQWLHDRTSVQTNLFQMAAPLVLRHDNSL